ncbi:MAG TPA: motility-associated protein, partial [Blastocatellia bacterium]|nr:motility-associated protein [Blastocatellia bacterium]
MLVLIGLIIVFLSVLGGFVMMSGPLAVLIQPSELIVILGAVLGTIVVGSPGKMLGLLVKKLPSLVKSSPYNSNTF